MPESTLTRVVRKIKLATKEADEKEQQLQKLQMQINFITNQIKSKQEKYEKSRGEMEIDNEKLYKMKSIHYIRETVTLPAIEWTLKEKENEIQERKVTVENYKVKVKSLQKDCLNLYSINYFADYELKINAHIDEKKKQIEENRQELMKMKEQDSLILSMTESKRKFEEDIRKSQMLNSLLEEKVATLSKEIEELQTETNHWRIRHETVTKEIQKLDKEYKLLVSKSSKLSLANQPSKTTNFTKNTTEYHQSSSQKPAEKMEMPNNNGDTTNDAGRIANTEFVSATTVLTSSLPKSKFSFKKV